MGTNNAEKKTKKIKIDLELCIGCGSCEAIDPDNFELKGDKATVKEQYSKENESKIEEAMNNCPVGAIEIVEE